jgi:hypothetical protein
MMSRLGLLVGERDRRQHVGADVDAQHEKRRQRQRQAKGDEGQERHQLGDVRADGVRDALLEIVANYQTALLDALARSMQKLSSMQNHLGGLLAHVASRRCPSRCRCRPSSAQASR